MASKSAQGDFMPSSSFSTTSAGTPRMVEVNGATVIVDRFESARLQPRRNHCRPPNFFHHIFLVRSSQTCSQPVRRYLDSASSRSAPVSRDDAFPAADFPTLFDKIWPRSAPSQVHAKQQNSTLKI